LDNPDSNSKVKVVDIVTEYFGPETFRFFAFGIAACQRVHPYGVAHASELGAESRIRLDVGSMFQSKCMEQRLEDRQLRLKRCGIRRLELRAMRSI
jgi:hypothetical protein